MAPLVTNWQQNFFIGKLVFTADLLGRETFLFVDYLKGSLHFSKQAAHYLFISLWGCFLHIFNLNERSPLALI